MKRVLAACAALLLSGAASAAQYVQIEIGITGYDDGFDYGSNSMHPFPYHEEIIINGTLDGLSSYLSVPSVTGYGTMTFAPGQSMFSFEDHGFNNEYMSVVLSGADAIRSFSTNDVVSSRYRYEPGHHGSSHTGGITSFDLRLSDTAFAGPAFAESSLRLPEPATWATMVAGFGLVGGAMRRRRRPVPLAG